MAKIKDIIIEYNIKEALKLIRDSKKSLLSISKEKNELNNNFRKTFFDFYRLFKRKHRLFKKGMIYSDSNPKKIKVRFKIIK